MNQEQFLAQRDKLAQENHLGELELYCTPLTSRERAIFAAVFFGLFLVIGAFFALESIFNRQDTVPLFIPGFALLVVLFSLFISLMTFVFISPFGLTSVYIYTNGLVCLRRSGGRVVHWEEIRKVWIEDSEPPPTLFAELNDDTRFQFPSETGFWFLARSRGSASNRALQKFIEEKMAQARRGKRAVTI